MIKSPPKLYISLFLFSLIGAMFVKCSFGIGFSWSGKINGIREAEVKALSLSPADHLVAFAGTKEAIYKTKDGAKTWQKVFQASAGVNFIQFDPVNPSHIYAATNSGAYVSYNEGKNWSRIFRGVGNLENMCLWMAFTDDRIYLATRRGLFFSFDKGKLWQRAKGEIGSVEISCVALAKDSIYLATAEGVYKSDDNVKSWQRIFATSISQAAEAMQDYDFEIDEELKISLIKFIAVDPGNSAKIYLATNSGIFLSLDLGNSWQRFEGAGLLNSDIQYIFISSKNEGIFSATKKGIFEFKKNKWESIYQGLTANKVNLIQEDIKGVMWLATDRGVFKGEIKFARDVSGGQSSEVLDNFTNEPSIQEIQKKAIEYAEVSPKKISSWRRQAAVKALMPDLTLDFDKTITTSLGATYDRTQVGPQDWAVNLKWNVGELIWNSDQTSIDSRSKLMVELRDDILNEVTRLYFERRRLQAEGILSPPQNKKEEIESNLRLAELTASIDALTGGYLTQMLDKSK